MKFGGSQMISLPLLELEQVGSNITMMKDFRQKNIVLLPSRKDITDLSRSACIYTLLKHG
jgi:hypothetical protein